jgi:hypothetical protein
MEKNTYYAKRSKCDYGMSLKLKIVGAIETEAYLLHRPANNMVSNHHQLSVNG